jgi:hypothetical protein
MDGLQAVFAKQPSGSTPLGSTLKRIYKDTDTLPEEKDLLVLILTDGAPDNRSSFYSALVNKKPNVHVSIASLTDNEEDMAYLDAWVRSVIGTRCFLARMFDSLVVERQDSQLRRHGRLPSRDAQSQGSIERCSRSVPLTCC